MRLLARSCLASLPLLLLAGAARADGDEPAASAPFAAFAVAATAAGLPLVIGGNRAASAPTDPQKNTGFLLAASGLALAPLLAHVAVREHGRGFAFAAVPVASLAGMAALVQTDSGAVFHGTVGSRAAFGILFGVSAIASAIGVADALLAGDRARPDRGRVSFSVGGGPGLLSLGVGGRL